MTKGRPVYSVLDHTADVEIELTAPTLGALFESAALAMFDLMVDVETVGTTGPPTAIVVEAPDREALLVAWLGEWLSRAMAGATVWGGFSVDRLSQTDCAGRAWGEPLDATRHRFKTELKAVTYHDLAVRPQDSGWWARLVFDL